MNEELKELNVSSTTAYETMTVEQSAQALQTDLENGLTTEEAQRRLEKYGPNKLQEKKKKSWIRIIQSMCY